MSATTLHDNKELIRRTYLHLEACHDPLDCPYCVQFEDALIEVLIGIRPQENAFRK